MIRAEYKGDLYEVMFSYVRENQFITVLDSAQRIVLGHPKETECKIFKNKELFSNGIAVPHYTEPEFIKRIGRKYALTYAVEKFDRELRTLLWEAYIKECIL